MLPKRFAARGHRWGAGLIGSRFTRLEGLIITSRAWTTLAI
jgi:hypothetical protein